MKQINELIAQMQAVHSKQAELLASRYMVETQIHEQNEKQTVVDHLNDQI